MKIDINEFKRNVYFMNFYLTPSEDDDINKDKVGIIDYTGEDIYHHVSEYINEFHKPFKITEESFNYLLEDLKDGDFLFDIDIKLPICEIENNDSGRIKIYLTDDGVPITWGEVKLSHIEILFIRVNDGTLIISYTFYESSDIISFAYIINSSKLLYVRENLIINNYLEKSTIFNYIIQKLLCGLPFISIYSNLIKNSLSILEIFEGGEGVPNIKMGLKYLVHLISQIKKSHELSIIYNYEKQQLENIYPVLDNDLELLLQNIEVFYVNTKEIGTTVNVFNIFTHDIEEIQVPAPPNMNPSGIIIEEFEDEPSKIFIHDLLGTYVCDTGTIFIYMDRIRNYENSELIIQKVLLHELIHALLDTRIRIINNDDQKNRCLDILNNNKYLIEESIVNALVLFVYKEWSNVDNKIYDIIETFITNQPSVYKYGVTLHNKGELNLRYEILNLLLLKIQPYI